MNSRSNTRSVAFLTLSVLTHLALAAGVMIVPASNEKKIDSTAVDISNINESQVSPPAAFATEVSPPSKAPDAEEKSEKTPTAPTPPVAQQTVPAPNPAAQSPVISARKSQSPVAAKSSIAVKSNPVASNPPASRAQPTPPAAALAEETPVTTGEPADNPQAEVPTGAPDKAQPVAAMAHQAEAKPDQPATAEAAATASEEMNQATEKQLQEQEVQAAKEAAAIAALRVENDFPSEDSADSKADSTPDSKTSQAKQVESVTASVPATSSISGSSTRPESDQGVGEIRSIEQLTQIPGNARPQYDAEDRRLGRQGVVSFSAYVSKEGSISDFKMLQSSGHRVLDAKTLKALKSWKFKPGQEGLVEIPFQWSLKGEPQQIPALRIKKAQVSQIGG